MKHVILIIIAIVVSAGVMLAAYGKKGLKYRKEQGANDYITAIMMAVIIYFWGVDLLNYIQDPAGSSALTVVFVYGAPILLIIWAIYNRSKIKQEMSAPPKTYKKSSHK